MIYRRLAVMRNTFFMKSMRIAVPLAFQAMLQSSFSIIDEIMVGRLGENAIAAIEVGGKPGFVFTCVSGAIATVAGIQVSQYMGKEDDEKVDLAMSVNLSVMLLIALVTSAACFFIPSILAGIFTKDIDVINAAKGYIRIISIVYPLSGIATILAVQIRCKGYAQYPLYVSAASAMINTGLNYLLIFGKLGMPSLGIYGAGIASASSQAVSLIFMIMVHHKVCRLSFNLKMNPAECRQYAVILMPVVVNEFLWSVGQNVNTFIYGHMGTKELAGMSLTAPVQGLFIGALSGLSQAAGILIGKGLGECEYEKAYEESKRLCLYGFIGSVVLSFILILSRGLYAELYNVEEEVKNIGKGLLAAFAILAPVKVANMILGGGVIRSGGKTKYVMIIDILGTWLIGVPLGIITGLVLRFPIVWVYFILSQEELVRLVISVFIFRSRKWMQTIE